MSIRPSHTPEGPQSLGMECNMNINITPQANPQVTTNDISATERVLGRSLPGEFVEFVLAFGDAQFQENQHTTLSELSIESVLLPMDRPGSIISEWQEFLGRFPEKTIPIFQAAGGNYILFDYSKEAFLFWNHEKESNSDRATGYEACTEVGKSLRGLLESLVPMRVIQNAEILSVKIDPEFAKKMGIKR